MTVCISIIFFIDCLILFGCIYFFSRNKKVCEFRLYILDLNPNKIRACIKLYKKYSYEQMLFSFKPLRLEFWFTEEELKTME